MIHIYLYSFPLHRCIQLWETPCLNIVCIVRAWQENLSPKNLQHKGVYLQKLQTASQRTGMYGRLLVVFEPRKIIGPSILPSNTFGPGETFLIYWKYLILYNTDQWATSHFNSNIIYCLLYSVYRWYYRFVSGRGSGSAVSVGFRCGDACYSSITDGGFWWHARWYELGQRWTLQSNEAGKWCDLQETLKVCVFISSYS